MAQVPSLRLHAFVAGYTAFKPLCRNMYQFSFNIVIPQFRQNHFERLRRIALLAGAAVKCHNFHTASLYRYIKG